RPPDRRSGEDVHPDVSSWPPLGARDWHSCFHRRRAHAFSVAMGVAGARADRRRHRVGEAVMETNVLWMLAGRFALLSLFAVGGANAAIPEMHRLAVDVHHWMTDRQFADMF